jgi:type IV secretion system protein TrbG
MNKKSINLIPLIACFSTLAACSTVKYNPDDFVNPNKVVVKKVKVPALPEPKVRATFGIGNDPLVVRAYNEYTKTGRLKTIRSSGWTTYPYSINTKPVMSCQPLRLCVIQLEEGEKLSSVNVGDSTNWKIGEFATGEGDNSTISVTVKPVQYGIATDLIISTNKRTYNIGLASKNGAKVSILRFYYPEETRIDTVTKALEEQAGKGNKSNSSKASTVISDTAVNLDHVNFNYKIKGASSTWRPNRVFDDANKTYIEMPAIASHTELPILYLARGKKFQMVNYRYKKPYFIVDGLFSRAWLVSGKGKSQQRIEIINQNMQV